jgi:hypothetical protein
VESCKLSSSSALGKGRHSMAVYRFYRLDPAGHVLGRRDVQCANDDAARSAVSQTLRLCEAAELWEGMRRVCVVTRTLSGATQVVAPSTRERPGRRSSATGGR